MKNSRFYVRSRQLCIPAAVRRAKSNIKRKDLAKQVQVEYIKSFYEVSIIIHDPAFASSAHPAITMH